MKNNFKISKNSTIPKKINNYLIEKKLFEINLSSIYAATNIYINEKVLIRAFPKFNLSKK